MGGDALRRLNGSKNSTLTDMIIDHIEEDKKQARLEAWYKKDGRDDASHPLHRLYTGLAEKYMNKEESGNV
jgi:hypothetical protein